MSNNYNLERFEETERYKRIIRNKINSFPKLFYVIYIIFAIANIILIIYLLSLNYNNDSNIFNFIIPWIIFIFGFIIFLVNSVLFFMEFSYKKIIITVLLFIQASLFGLSIIITDTYGHIAPTDRLYYFGSLVLNVITLFSSFLPLYFVY